MHSPFYSSYLQYTGFTDAFQDDSCIFIVLCVTTNIQERFQTFLLEGVLGDELVDLNMGHETRWVVQARLKMVLCEDGLPQNDLQKT